MTEDGMLMWRSATKEEVEDMKKRLRESADEFPYSEQMPILGQDTKPRFPTYKGPSKKKKEKKK